MSDAIEHDRDPARDSVLAAALADLDPEPPTDAVDWDRLERTVALRAREHLAGRSPGAAWWELVAAWARPAIPLGVAAGIVLFLVVLRLPARPAEPPEPLLLGDEVAESVYRGDPGLLLRAAFTSEDPIP
jgi:hypothetical protein